ncbi:MAG: cell division protein FtsZ [Candidatus Odinarchaeum yellowstonii]|uniref:Cell division protein FtsZ n=1 Tax=Odinarchaeota yellowstonii (strain LCB_4) TaxID=1841599 RepID=A0AAF0D3V8_ODILC|nr:MAG: cell division protein FtsZ [Candidatus Odinarchaeum yellowstonii]
MRSLIEDALAHARYEEKTTPVKEAGNARIVVVGTGGGGNNTINRLLTLGIHGAECIAINTDRQHLDFIKAHRKILIGEMITRGLGAGGYPEVGAAAADESRDAIKAALQDSDLVFIAAGMGGGTGTGSAPIIAEIAKDCGAIVVGVVTMPFHVEKARIEKAKVGLEKLQKYADTVVVIDNNRLLEIAPNLPIDKAFCVADEVLANMVKGITETITLPSLINLDYADVRTIMTNGGVALVGLGEASSAEIGSESSSFSSQRSPNINKFKLAGRSRAEIAVKNALNTPLLEVDYEGATGALIHVVGGEDLTLEEANYVAKIVTDKMDPNAMVIWGARVDPQMNGVLRVMLILTGVKSPQILGNSRRERTEITKNHSAKPSNYSSTFTGTDLSVDSFDLGLDRIE